MDAARADPGYGHPANHGGKRGPMSMTCITASGVVVTENTKILADYSGGTPGK
jgi:hypothetical protein